MSGPGPFDPRINCAAEICCPDGQGALLAILRDLGIPEEYCCDVAKKMKAFGIAFAPASLMAEIADLADHPGRRA